MKTNNTNHEKPIIKTPAKLFFDLADNVLVFALQKNKQVGEGNTKTRRRERDPRANTSKNSQVVSAA